MEEPNVEVPFWIETPGYAIRDRLMFICGVEYERIRHQVVDDGFRGDWPMLIHSENESRVRMMCHVAGASAITTPMVDKPGYSTLTVVAPEYEEPAGSDACY